MIKVILETFYRVDSSNNRYWFARVISTSKNEYLGFQKRVLFHTDHDSNAYGSLSDVFKLEEILTIEPRQITKRSFVRRSETCLSKFNKEQIKTALEGLK